MRKHADLEERGYCEIERQRVMGNSSLGSARKAKTVDIETLRWERPVCPHSHPAEKRRRPMKTMLHTNWTVGNIYKGFVFDENEGKGLC